MSCASCQQRNSPRSVSETIKQAEKIVLYQGLRRESSYLDLSEAEKQARPLHELNGYWFYQDPLSLTDNDLVRLLEILGNEATYRPFGGEKKCGGFHPDFAIEWQVGELVCRALLCFGCSEAKLFGPDRESRHDMPYAAKEKLEALLKPYKKKRPVATTDDPAATTT